jgi:staphylococcal nuclease domain-containing protein 1
MISILPATGSAKVKSVLSGDTVVLLGRASGAGGKAPEVTFTFERVTAPRMASKANNNVDDPEAFPSREWLRNLCVGKTVYFETR